MPWDFRVSAGRNAGVWTTIPVPSCWDTKGFGSYEYGGINTTEYGEYKKTFNVPADWAGKRVFLVFEGSMTDTEPAHQRPAAGRGNGGSEPAAQRARLEQPRIHLDGAGRRHRRQRQRQCQPRHAHQLHAGLLGKARGGLQHDGPTRRFPRLMLLGATAGYDGSGNGAYLSVYNSGTNTRTLQFKIIRRYGVISSPNVLSGSDWTFVAVTYDSTLGSNQVKFYVGNRSGALASPGVHGHLRGGSLGAVWHERIRLFPEPQRDRDRAFDGLGDDFRIFNGALTQAQLETVRGSGLSASVTPPTPLYQWNFNNATTGTTVAPVVGTGGVLTLQNSAGTATDLYSPIGGGVSGSQAATGGGFTRVAFTNSATT